MDAYIKAISYYCPDTFLTNEQIAKENPEWTIDKIASKTGIYKRAKADIGVTSGDLAFEAAEILFKEHHIEKRSIDFILLCTQSPDYFLPTTACVLQNRLGLNTTTGALDFNLGCSGFVYGLILAKSLVQSGTAKNVLLITAETYSKFIHSNDKSNKTLFGDAAAATLITSEGYAEIQNSIFGTDGSGAENLIVINGAMRHPDKNGCDIHNEEGFIRNDNNLYQNGNEIFKFAATFVPKLVKDVLASNNLSMGEIDLFVFHQANKYLLNFIRKSLAIPEDKFYFFIENIGNTVSSTVPIALYEAIKEKKINPGNNVLISGFGVGYSWAGTVLKF